MDPYVSRTGGTMARSPSERLEPTRPPARPRHRRDNREPRRASPFLRFLNGLLTFVLLLMLIVGAAEVLPVDSIPAAPPGRYVDPYLVDVPDTTAAVDADAASPADAFAYLRAVLDEAIAHQDELRNGAMS